jgi:hypothetical protein
MLSISDDVENSSTLRGDLHIVIFSIEIYRKDINLEFPRWVTSTEVFTSSGML